MGRPGQRALSRPPPNQPPRGGPGGPGLGGPRWARAWGLGLGLGHLQVAGCGKGQLSQIKAQRPREATSAQRKQALPPLPRSAPFQAAEAAFLRRSNGVGGACASRAAGGRQLRLFKRGKNETCSRIFLSQCRSFLGPAGSAPEGGGEGRGDSSQPAQPPAAVGGGTRGDHPDLRPAGAATPEAVHWRPWPSLGPPGHWWWLAGVTGPLPWGPRAWPARPVYHVTSARPSPAAWE